jgi:succinate dehydrogenase / fumarate reductase flavoprotein subunit
MHGQVGIFRTQEDLEAALRELQGLNERWRRVRVEGTRTYNPGWHLVRDLRNLLIVSEAIAKSALLRKESRGAHSRLDHPETDPQLGKVNMCAVRTAQGMRVSPTPLPEMPANLRELFEPAKEKVG